MQLFCILTVKVITASVQVLKSTELHVKKSISQYVNFKNLTANYEQLDANKILKFR